jgi:hypothetical protein
MRQITREANNTDDLFYEAMDNPFWAPSNTRYAYDDSFDAYAEDIDEAVHPIYPGSQRGTFRVEQRQDINDQDARILRLLRPNPVTPGVWVAGGQNAAIALANRLRGQTINNQRIAGWKLATQDIGTHGVSPPHLHLTNSRGEQISSHIFFGGRVPEGDWAEFDAYDAYDAYNDVALWRADDLDAMIDEALASFPGGRGGRVRTDISPWPSLLSRTVQALRRAIGFLAPPVNPRSLNNALHQINGAEALLNNAAREIGRIMSGAQRTRVLDQLSNAVIRIRAARGQARGTSAFVPGGRSLMDPRVSLRGAIEHIGFAREAIGLRVV